MPVGKPTPEGDVVMGSRHYGGQSGSLGTASIWDCPACGKKNEGRRPEQGCGYCGAGDPTTSKAGTPTGPAPRQPDAGERTGHQGAPPRPVSPAGMRDGGTPAPQRPVETMRVLRLVEYLIAPGQDANLTLRRSLVGTMHFAWGQLTGTIIDSTDERQEDLLRMARRQPGVWLGNDTAMQQQDDQDRHRAPRPRGPLPGGPLHPQQFEGMPQTPYVDYVPLHQERIVDMPDTGPAYSADDEAVARNIVRLWGYKLANTLALALQSIAEELAANMEPDKFLSYDEALALANALIHQIPDDWNPQPEGEQPPPPPAAATEEQARARAAVARVREGSTPSVTFTEIPGVTDQ